MALPCLGYLFESDSVCMCCTSCLYPLIRDRCGPLGSHQERKKLHPPFLFPPPRFSLVLFSLPRSCGALPCFHACCPVRATSHTAAKEQNRESVQSAKVSVATNHMEKLERRFFLFWGGGGFIKAGGRGKGDIKARCGSLS